MYIQTVNSTSKFANMARHCVQLPKLLIIVTFLLSTTAGTALAIEEPAFTLVQSIEDMEIREYQQQLVAETIVTGTRKEASSDGFRIIADYIFGNNRAADKIAMTAPVSQSSEKKKQKIAMTAPVATKPATGTDNTDAEQASHIIRFTMPAEYTMDTLPQPNNDAVTIKIIPGRTMAVMQFSGYARESKVSKWEKKLQQAVTDAELSSTGDVELAQYSAPWIPGFLRRNEVMIEITP